MGTWIQYNWFQYLFVFNLYRRMNKFEYISENRHTVVSETCLHYLTIGNWFHNFRLFYLQWRIWIYLITYNLFSIQWFKEVKDFFTGIYVIFLLKNHKYYYFRDYTEKLYTCLILYLRRKFYINNIIICKVMKRIITICRESLLSRWDSTK